RRALKAPERAHRESDGLRIAAVRARANDGEVVGSGRPAILGLEDGEASHLRARETGAAHQNQPRKHEATKESIFFSCLRVFVAIHSSLKWRVIAEYSSICVVRFSGYEMVTLVMSPASFVTA